MREPRSLVCGPGPATTADERAEKSPASKASTSTPPRVGCSRHPPHASQTRTPRAPEQGGTNKTQSSCEGRRFGGSTVFTGPHWRLLPDDVATVAPILLRPHGLRATFVIRVRATFRSEFGRCGIHACWRQRQRAGGRPESPTRSCDLEDLVWDRSGKTRSATVCLRTCRTRLDGGRGHGLRLRLGLRLRWTGGEHLIETQYDIVLQRIAVLVGATSRNGFAARGSGKRRHTVNGHYRRQEGRAGLLYNGFATSLGGTQLRKRGLPCVRQLPLSEPETSRLVSFGRCFRTSVHASARQLIVRGYGLIA